MRCFQMVLRGSELRNSYLYYTHRRGHFSKNVCQLVNWKSAGFFPKKKPLSGFICKDYQIFAVQVYLLHLTNLIHLDCSNITHLTDHQLICYELGIPPMPLPNRFLKVIHDLGYSYLVPLLLLYNTNKKTPLGFLCASSRSGSQPDFMRTKVAYNL